VKLVACSALALAFVACQSSDVSRVLGARCTLSSECAQMCLGPSAEWPGGLCTTTCDTDADCSGNAHCIAENGGVCAFACENDGDCAFLDGGYTCMSADPEDTQNQGLKVMVCEGS
jgi:hypothetical protein